MKKTLFTMSVLLLLLLSSCVSYYRGGLAIPEKTETPEGISAPIFYGYGRGSNRGTAEDQAIRNALVRASLSALQDQAVLYRDNVESLFSRNVRLDSYVISSSLEQVDWDLDNGSYEMIISIRVLLPEVSRLLRENDISGGLVRDNIALRMADQELPPYTPATRLSDVLEPVSSTWEDTGYKPTFLVYYDEQQVADPFTARMAVQTANGYLSSIGFPYVDLSQIESIKLDQEYAFQEETGSSSMLRQIASRLHADYYIDVAVSSSTFSRSGSYYAEVSVLLSAYDSSTATGRGSMFVQSEEPVRGATRNAAIDKAVSEAVEKGMAEIMEKTAVYFVQDADRGQNYELIIMKTYQDKVVRTLEQLIAEQVESFRRISFSPEESRYSIQYSGGMDELIEIVYESSELIPELQRIYLVYQRGNSITFNTGW
jgi:hypothetical protein